MNAKEPPLGSLIGIQMVDEIVDPSIFVPDVVRDEALELPPVVAGHESPAVQRKAESFYRSVAHMFQALGRAF